MEHQIILLQENTIVRDKHNFDHIFKPEMIWEMIDALLVSKWIEIKIKLKRVLDTGRCLYAAMRCPYSVRNGGPSDFGMADHRNGEPESISPFPPPSAFSVRKNFFGSSWSDSHSLNLPVSDA